jgi:2-oxoglutarate dehydrogenase E2 component (dihydrolipoamide succinyltransferase)
VQAGEDAVGEVLALIEEKRRTGKLRNACAASKTNAEKTPQKEKELERGDGREAERRPAPQITPVASRLAQEMGIDVSSLTGTGSEGRVTRADVEQFLQAGEKSGGQEQVPAEPPSGMISAAGKLPEEQVKTPEMGVPTSRREDRVRMSRRRRTIAQRLLEAKQTTAMLHLQRGRYERGDGPAQAAQRGFPGALWPQAGLYVIFREGCDWCVEGFPAGEWRDPGR